MAAKFIEWFGSFTKILATASVIAIVAVHGQSMNSNVRFNSGTACIEAAPEAFDVLTLSRQDIVDIKKVATTEVVKSLKSPAFENQVHGVVDTILNRTRSGHWGALKNVVNAKNQFSAIAGPQSLRPYGSVDKMPNRAISSKVAAEVDRWLEMRARGVPSSVGDNLNYLNPLYSSQSSLRGWGWSVVAQARKSGYVMGAGKATHYHGTSRDLVKYKPSAFRVVIQD
ncbi:cell wall hydrolase [Agrobacterium fabrum]|uniref:cell wall hydrolase n=1 Tax=Agrobacterium fabrum TaxID=1176649 RepID=UPI0009BA1E5C|nr:cell wall hydrolase [Agrobacterium fabrum]UXT57425.1 hypothetical protein FY134_07075 [Agrobacterium fabrum]WCK77713.1 cell wall hydrolase [Agrobacterium fabrum]WIE28753.1 cell wall hydrolase [Agrobacterium fabrum]WIE44711.1 cell wall hydrolase [Agrobacterium fabrum]CUX13700.1 hypothetical protein AGR8A_Cc30717 [Agrobacterium fabrum str. J-07]